MTRVIMVIPAKKQSDAQKLVPQGGWDIAVYNKNTEELFGYYCDWPDPKQDDIDTVESLDGKVFYLEGAPDDGIDYHTRKNAFKAHRPDLLLETELKDAPTKTED